MTVVVAALVEAIAASNVLALVADTVEVASMDTVFLDGAHCCASRRISSNARLLILIATAPVPSLTCDDDMANGAVVNYCSLL